MEKKCTKTKLGDVVYLRKEQVSPAECYGMKFVGLEHLHSGQHDVTDFGLIDDQRSLKSKFFSGDVLYGKLRPYLDKGGLVSFDGCCSTDILVFVTDKNKTIPGFISQIIHTNEFVSYAMTHINGTNHPRTSWNELAKFEFYLPPLSEQRRIASTLSAVDKAIEQAGIAIDDSERMKRGLMHELLNCSDSNTSLKDIFDFKNGKKYTGITGNVPIYGGNGILGYATENNCDNAIIIGRVGANCGSVHYEKSKCWVSDNAIICKKKSECSYAYLYYTLLTLNLNTIHVGSGQPLMTKGILDKLSVYLPPIEKQEKIVQILLNADEDIKLKNHRKSLLETLKRGMMQQLLSGVDQS